MTRTLIRIASSAILLATCAIVASSVPFVEHPMPDQRQTSGYDKVDSLFNCQHYQQAFEKKYETQDEATTRCVYVLAAAINVFTSGVAYKYRKQDYYLAVNKFSDCSVNELIEMFGRSLSGEAGVEQERDEVGDFNQQHTNSVDVAVELQAEIKKALDETDLDETLIDENRRTKRDAPNSLEADHQQLPPRHVSMDMLVESAKHDSDLAEPIEQVVKQSPSADDDYNVITNDVISQRLVDEQKTCYLWWYKNMSMDSFPSGTELNSEFANLADSSANLASDQPTNVQPEAIGSEQSNELPDEMFVDLRDSGCFSPARFQGACDSCLTFATVAFLEYMHCKKEGKLTAFSEQYMLDCGHALVDGMNGCSGSTGMGAIKFIANFGAELRENYPYTGQVGECPYNKYTQLNTTGYIRFDSNDLLLVPIDFWPELLENGHPLQLTFGADVGLFSYSGGIYDGSRCLHPNHAVLLVGHGREDGVEFWLIRNSYGDDWGEDGYFRLAKSAPKICLETQSGFTFGTKDGEHFAEPKRNALNGDALYKKLVLNQ